MGISMLNIGFGNFVSSQRVIAVVGPESAPIKRLVSDAREIGKLIDATYGRKTRAVIIMDSGHVLLTSVQPETMYNRITGKKLPDETAARIAANDGDKILEEDINE